MWQKCVADLDADLGDAVDVMMSKKKISLAFILYHQQHTLCDENRKTQYQYMKYACVCVGACCLFEFMSTNAKPQ